MKKRMLSLLLALVLLLAALPVTTFAATAENVVVKDATYYGGGSLKSITTAFKWSSAGVTDARLILSSERLNGSYSGKPGYGDFSDAGDIYDLNFKTYSDAEAYDNANGKPYGFIRASDPMDISNNNITMGLTIPEGTIPLDKDGTYFIYLWVTYRSHFYPDNLICVIQVQNGNLLYTPATKGYMYRNHYESDAFTPVENEAKFDVTVIPGGNMTRVAASGAESQRQLSSAMTPVIYTADAGCHFPESYSVNPVNGIMVKRVSDTQIQVYGTPSAATTISLAPAVLKTDESEHTCIGSGWKWDDDNHWKWVCTEESCQNYHAQTKRAAHVFTDDYDAVCNDCGYTRTPPAQHPETGDITSIPLWTMLFLGGTALLWMQLAQRKKERS